MATGSVTGEVDQVMGDQYRADQELDLAPGNPAQRKFPEFDFVVAKNPDFPENIAKHDQAELDIRP